MARPKIRESLAELLCREAQEMTDGELQAFRIELMRRLPAVVGEAAQAARGGVMSVVTQRIEDE